MIIHAIIMLKHATNMIIDVKNKLRDASKMIIHAINMLKHANNMTINVKNKHNSCYQHAKTC